MSGAGLDVDTDGALEAEIQRAREAAALAAALDDAERINRERAAELAEKQRIADEIKRGTGPTFTDESEAARIAWLQALRDEKFEEAEREKEALLEQGFTVEQIGEVQYGVDAPDFDPFVDLIPPEPEPEVVVEPEPFVEQPAVVDVRAGNTAAGYIALAALISFGLAMRRG